MEKENQQLRPADSIASYCVLGHSSQPINGMRLEESDVSNVWLEARGVDMGQQWFGIALSIEITTLDGQKLLDESMQCLLYNKFFANKEVANSSHELELLGRHNQWKCIYRQTDNWNLWPVPNWLIFRIIIIDARRMAPNDHDLSLIDTRW